MNEVNQTLYIPLYGKSFVSRRGIILNDPAAERIWESEGFKLKGKARSKWLSYNMAMRARIFDDWTKEQLAKHKDALVLHIGCGLDSRHERINASFKNWIDADLAEVIEVRKKYYKQTDTYQMLAFDASCSEDFLNLPEAKHALVILEGISMYLNPDQLNRMFQALSEKYESLSILMDVYTTFGAKASRFKNPIREVGVSQVWGVDDVRDVLKETGIHFCKEHSLTPDSLVHELKGVDRLIFKTLFQNSFYQKIYRLFELEKKPRKD